ncbi:MAG: DUF3450 domain-containing protein [Kangiellaceae bacterium]|jgi:hypothetical protein|nr:DUF3450 domain-containing protein [Kangiellaceae bacterium]
MKLASIVMMSVIYISSSFAAENLEPVIEKSSKINESAAKSQQKVDKINDQIENKLAAYKAVNKEIDGYKVYNLQLQKQIENQIKQIDNLTNSIDEVSVIERQIMPLMLRMIDGLEEFVNIDLPFQKAERLKRVATLREIMDRPDVSVAEKFRQVMEAYQIELDYGRTLKPYQDNLEINGQEQPVNFLRVGRVALFFQSKDKKTQGIWNQEKGDWEYLDGSYSSRIATGIKMAREQMAPDMLNLPIFSAKK